MALGSAFIAANVSKSFQIQRRVGIMDSTPLPMGLKLLDLVPPVDSEGESRGRGT